LTPHTRDGEQRLSTAVTALHEFAKPSLLSYAIVALLPLAQGRRLESSAMAELLRPDICVIGAGSGGLTVAAAAAGFGVPVVLIEKGKMGGDCLNTGCVPSKALIAAAKHSDALVQAKSFGILAGGLSVDFPAVHKHVTAVIAAIEPNDSKERFTGLGVRMIEGAARFRDARTVAVHDAIEIMARRFVIATGSSPKLPPIPGLKETRISRTRLFSISPRRRSISL
jgi:pyruvate/2-oxoglutarate dehydrogenase complex dihydrolipoamide dehydrogenase (E3) component